MADWHSMRSSDADRERAADLLKAAMSEGRLSWAEYQERLDKLMSSKNYGEIQRLLADLPSGIGPQTVQGATAHPVQRRPAGYPAVPQQTEPLATAALICGVLVPFTCGLSAVPAVITGHLALNRLNQTGDPGRGMAVAGLVLGYLPAALVILVIVGLFGWGI